MMTNDGELLAAQARVQVIQAMLAHARKPCTSESFQDQAKGWLTEWQRLDEEIRAYLSIPAACFLNLLPDMTWIFFYLQSAV